MGRDAGVHRLCCVVLSAVCAGCSATTPAVPDSGTTASARDVDLSAWEGVVDDASLRQLRQLWKVSAGESADWDGDGVLDLVVLKTPEGVTRIRYEPNPRQRPVWVSEKRPDGSWWLGVDHDGTSFFHTLVEESPAEHKTVITKDLNLNKKYDHREIRLIDEAAGVVHVTDEEAPMEDGVWQTVATQDDDIFQLQGSTSCNPPFLTTTDAQVNGPHPNSNPTFTVATTTPGRCSGEQLKATERAVACVFKRLSCIEKTNTALGARLLHALTEDIRIGCEPQTTCPSVWGVTMEGGHRISLFEDAFGDETRLCEVLLHELLHIIKVDKSPTHNKGTWDRVYACSTLCTSCSSAGRAAKSAANVCADCAETPKERAACGVEIRLASCDINYTHCHGGIGVNSSCAEPKCNTFYDCAGNLIMGAYAPEYRCCNSCPVDAPKNDVPCTGVPTTSSECAQTPAVCTSEGIP